jgi:hypothetical protein
MITGWLTSLPAASCGTLGGIAMYMRIVRAQPPAGQADALAERWAAFWPERLRALPGFRHAHFGVDRQSGAIAGVTVFDQRPDDATFERLSAEFQATLGAAQPAQPREMTVYEITRDV